MSRRMDPDREDDLRQAGNDGYEKGYQDGYDDGAAMMQSTLDDLTDSIRVILTTHHEQMHRARGNICAVRARTIAAIERVVKF
jgi:flagellar biosynthesis/type III secretory pathway protein FliH